jgi:hypothetical protein
MAGFNRDTVYADNVDFTGSVFPTPQVTLNGQLLIGSSVAPNIRVGKLTSTGGTVTITNGNGTINLEIAGSGVAVEHLTGTTGGTLNPDGANNFTLHGGTVAAGTTPVAVAGVGSTLTTNVQISQALAAADATKIGLANFDSASFAVAATGFVTMAGGGGFTWNDVSGAFSPLKNNGYFITGTATGTLPAAPAQGDTVKFFVDHASQLLTIDAPGTQIIRLATVVSSAGGTFISTAQGDAVELTYRASDTCWCAITFVGAWNHT